MPSIYDHACRYVRDLGWSLVPIPPNTKGPNQPGWNRPENLKSDIEACEWWKVHSDWNIGVQLEESKIVILDIDNVEYTKQLFSAFGLDYDTLLKGAPRIRGRNDRDKAVFKAPDIPLSRHALSWPDPDTEKPVTVIEFRAGAIQDVLPPSIHPDTKKPYKWIVDLFSDIPDLPRPILTIWTEWDRFKNQLQEACPWGKKANKAPSPVRRKTVKSDDSVIQRFNSDNDVSVLLEQYGYTRVSDNRYLSPYSSSRLPGVVVFPAENRIYSHHASEPFDTDHSLDAFDLFTHFEHGGNVQSAIKAVIDKYGITRTVQGDAEHGRKIVDSWSKQKKVIPDDLLTVPGLLGKVVEYYNDTSPKNQPQFAVQCALALGSTVMGRRWRTCQNNYPSCYFVNVGRSSCGKEHAKTIIEDLLSQAQCSHLIGPPNYTSAGGVFSSLMDQPSHVAIMDELGKILESALKSNSSNKLDAMTAIMEVFGRLGGILRAPGYSRMGKTQAQKAEMDAHREIHHPALTILAMTTPETLYNALSSQSITSGFLPRFIIVESDFGRQPSRRITPTEPDKSIIEWVRMCASAKSDEGNLSEDMGAGNPPNPVVIEISNEAMDLYDLFEEELIRLQNNLDRHGIAQMLGRAREISMRVGLIVAVSCGHSMVMEEDAQWAIHYVNYYFRQTVNMVIGRVSNSEFERVCKEVYDVIVTGADRGRTDSEISRLSPLFRGLDPKKRESVLTALQIDYGIDLVEFTHNAGGRPRRAWVAPEEKED